MIQTQEKSILDVELDRAACYRHFSLTFIKKNIQNSSNEKDEGIIIDGEILNNLVYADDVALLATCYLL